MPHTTSSITLWPCSLGEALASWAVDGPVSVWAPCRNRFQDLRDFKMLTVPQVLFWEDLLTHSPVVADAMMSPQGPPSGITFPPPCQPCVRKGPHLSAPFVRVSAWLKKTKHPPCPKSHLLPAIPSLITNYHNALSTLVPPMPPTSKSYWWGPLRKSPDRINAQLLSLPSPSSLPTFHRCGPQRCSLIKALLLIISALHPRKLTCDACTNRIS